ELFGVTADGQAVEPAARHLGDAFGERGRTLVENEHACFARPDRLERAAAAKRDDRPPAGLRFEGHNPEIFLSGQENGKGATIQISNLFVRSPSEKFDVRAGSACQVASLRSVA